MRTVVEFWALARDSAVLWLRCWVPLVGWFSLGYGINELAGHVSTLLVGQKILGTTIIVFGIVAWVACLVLAIHGLAPALHAVSAPEGTAVAALAASLPGVALPCRGHRATITAWRHAPRSWPVRTPRTARSPCAVAAT